MISIWPTIRLVFKSGIPAQPLIGQLSRRRNMIGLKCHLGSILLKTTLSAVPFACLFHDNPKLGLNIRHQNQENKDRSWWAIWFWQAIKWIFWQLDRIFQEQCLPSGYGPETGMQRRKNISSHTQNIPLKKPRKVFFYFRYSTSGGTQSTTKDW